MSDSHEKPHALPYATGPALDRRRLVRWIVIVIVCKIVMVGVNVGMAFGGAPDVLRIIGLGVQIALTGLFLVLILKLVSR